MQLEHVNEADSRFLLHRLSGAAVEQALLTVRRQSGLSQEVVDALLGRAVEYWGHRLKAEQRGGPAEVRLENLADVHTTGNAERIEHDLNRRAVRQKWHVFDRQNLGDHALVPVAAGHLVADADYTLGGDIVLHHLQHAAPQLVA